MGFEITILVFLILLNAFFAASEIALISLNDNKIKAMAESGHKKAKLLQQLLSEPSKFLATIQIGITLAGFLASAFAAETFAGGLASYLYALGVPLTEELLETISLIMITLVLSYFTLVFGELVPKRLAMTKAEPISFFVVKPLTWLSKISMPFVKLLTLSTNTLVRLMGVDPYADREQVTEEEIRMMVDVGNENGTIQESEKMMINNIFEFDNKSVSDIMTNRRNIVGIPIEMKLSDVVKLVHDEKYTRFPVYEQSIDHIIGILHVKDLFQFICSVPEKDFKLTELIRTPYFIPESKRTNELFKDLQKTKVHMAVAIDEYGGTAGIVTLEDLVEEIVGNIYDEHDEEEKTIEKLDDGTYMIDGIINLRTVEDLLDIELPTDDYDTLNGFLIGQLGRIPEHGEQPHVEYNGLTFQVEKMDEKRISKVKVKVKLSA